MRLAFKLLGAIGLIMLPTMASATITDPPNDLLPTYLGPSGADIDILSADITFDGTNFHLSTTEAGAIGSTPNSLFAWAVNRGAGVARPPAAPPAGSAIPWDAVVVMFPDGTLRVVTFIGNTPSILTLAGQTIVGGNSLSATVPLALLPSTGFAGSDYTFSLWSRVRTTSGVDGPNSEVADLLAGSGTLQATAVPEPATWMSLLLGLGVVGSAFRWRRARCAVRV